MRVMGEEGGFAEAKPSFRYDTKLYGSCSEKIRTGLNLAPSLSTQPIHDLRWIWCFVSPPAAAIWKLCYSTANKW